MKTKFLLAIFASVFSLSALAEKIAVVDMAAAIFSSQPAKTRIEKAQKSADFTALKAKYESSTADLQNLAKEWDAKSVTWSAEQKADHQKKMEYAKADRELAMRKLQSENQELEQSIAQELQSVASKALQEIVDKEGITLILPRESIIWSKAELNITGKLVDAINKAN